uniref:Uncharacterized protein n=1 Tax=Rhizophora mucronata TaxID=61149 RepID=A0A2P2P360_RHIMU
MGITHFEYPRTDSTIKICVCVCELKQNLIDPRNSLL